MNKKIILLLLILLFSALNAFAARPPEIPVGSLSLTWVEPNTTPYEITEKEKLDVTVKITCDGIAECENVTAKIQYCIGASCSSYINMTDKTQGLQIENIKKDPTTQNLGDFSGEKTVDWGIQWPEAEYGQTYKLKIIATATGLEDASLTGRELIMETPESSVSITSPSNGSTFFVGSSIDFNSEIVSALGTSYSVKWDSNKDIYWNHSEENFFSSELNIGDHNITITLTEGIIEKKDSIIISIKPVTNDVFSITEFGIIKVEPIDRYSVNGKIRVQAKLNYYLNQPIQGKAFLIISDAVTHKAIYGPSAYYIDFDSADSAEYDLLIDLSNYNFIERRNYKVEFLVVSNEVESSSEYFVDPIDPDSAYWDDGEPYNIPENQIPENHKSNNSGNQIIELGPATLPFIQAPEIHPTLIALIVFAVLILIRKKK